MNKKKTPKSFFLEQKLVLSFLAFSKTIRLPGFEKIPLYDILLFFIKGIKKSAINTRASSLAFKFFLALFPALIFLFTLIPYIPIENFHDQLLMQLKILMPQDAYSLTKTTIEDLIKHQRGGLLSFGFISTIYLATNSINAMIQAFNESYFVEEKRSFLKQRLISLVLLFILSTLALAAVSLIMFSNIAINYMVQLRIIQGQLTVYLLLTGKWVIILALFLFTISFLYYLGPSQRKQWKFISAGSTLATLLILLVSQGFAFYVNNFGQYNKLYGSIGTLIVLLLWIYFNSFILLIGFDLNASIQNLKQKENTDK